MKRFKTRITIILLLVLATAVAPAYRPNRKYAIIAKARKSVSIAKAADTPNRFTLQAE